MKRAEQDIRELMGPLDPMRAADPGQRTCPPSIRPSHRPRWLPIAAAAAVVGVTAAGLVAWNANRPNGPEPNRPVIIALTPAALVITAPADVRPADVVLAELADRAEASQTPSADRGGRTEYLVLQTAYLHTQVGRAVTISAVQPGLRKTWRNSDGSGKEEFTPGEPEFRNAAERAAWQSGSLEAYTETWPPGRETRFGHERPPTDVKELARRLTGSDAPNELDPLTVHTVVTDLLRERVLLPAERAALLRVVAQIRDLRFDGLTVDRAGRSAMAFSIDSANSGLPTRYTLLVGPDDGMILAAEQMLTERAGKLHVTIPAVISYEMYVEQRFE